MKGEALKKANIGYHWEDQQLDSVFSEAIRQQ